jgi:hypothetical protein
VTFLFPVRKKWKQKWTDISISQVFHELSLFRKPPLKVEDIQNHTKYSRQNQPLALSLAVIPFPAPSQVSSKASKEFAQVNRNRKNQKKKSSKAGMNLV